MVLLKPLIVRVGCNLFCALIMAAVGELPVERGNGYCVPFILPGQGKRMKSWFIVRFPCKHTGVGAQAACSFLFLQHVG